MVWNNKMLRHFDKLSSHIRGIPEREDKLKLRFQEWKDELKHFEKGLKNVKARKWNPKTKSIEIPLEDGKTKTLEFGNEHEFNAHKKSDTENLERKIKSIEQKVAEHEELYKRVFPPKKINKKKIANKKRRIETKKKKGGRKK